MKQEKFNRTAGRSMMGVKEELIYWLERIHGKGSRKIYLKSNKDITAFLKRKMLWEKESTKNPMTFGGQ